MTQPKPRPEKYAHLISDIRRGYIKIPKFQREFVWDIEDSAKLLDSILKGYPIGTFILWKTRERMKSVKNIGDVDLPPTPEGDSVQYVLDGQQRLASLFVVLEGRKVKKKNKMIDYKGVYVDLDEDIENDEPIVSSEEPTDNEWITLYDLLTKNITYFLDNYREYIDKIQNYKDKFTTYDFSTIVLQDYPMDAAVEIFTRINTTGTELTLFEIMSAKTYDEARKFDLQEEYKDLQADLGSVGYDTIPSSTVLQCLSVHLEEDCRRKTILKLEKDRVIDVWEDTVESVKSAVEYLKTYYRIPASRLLPYNALVVPFSYFFFIEHKGPDHTQENHLQEYFWRSSLSYRFTSGAETKLAQDVKRIKKIIDGERPDYDFKVQLNGDEIKEWWFSTGDSYCKAILGLLAYFGPKSFDNNAEVILDNSWLKQSNSRNYHHFFPKKFLQKQGISSDLANSIANITLVHERLNKRKIGARAPSDYMHEFSTHNPELEKTMKTHLIDDMHEFGIWEDDYERFLEERSSRILEELEKRINI